MSGKTLSGQIRKLISTLAEPIQYQLPIGKSTLLLNDFLGKTLSLAYESEIFCLHCGKKSKKSYSQGYCFPCSQTLARCDLCIVKPERCHYHLGTCREPEWGESHCLIPHVVYLANSSGLKVGVTRANQIPTRWIDQGAISALPIFKTETRRQAGLVEILLAKEMNDKTNWRKMLLGNIEHIDLEAIRKELLLKHQDAFHSVECLENEKIVELQYPVLEYPKKICSLGFEKTPLIKGRLLGIKGQYLILDTGVLNIRSHSGYHLSMEIL